MKRGQMTIFVIVAIVIVVVVALIFLINSDLLYRISGTEKEINPNNYLKNCIEKRILETTETLGDQGGYMSNKLNRTFMFSDEGYERDISYLCYTSNFYVPCKNQEPMLIQHLKDEIHEEIENDVQTCFDDLTDSLNDRGYVVDATYNGFEVEFEEGRIIIQLDNKLTLTRSGETSSYSDYKAIIESRFYDIAVVAQEIVSQEAEYCNFENLGFMLLYPEFEIDKFNTGDLETIYTITNTKSKERFRFFVRSCVIGAGL